VNILALVGIAGPSCSGKTELADRLAARLDAVLITLDSYYRDLSQLEPALREELNFDHPGALDRDLMVAQLRSLAGGASIHVPVYDFTSHTRTGSVTTVGPRDWIIVEGLFTLYFDAVRELLNARIFIELDDASCLARRIARDTRLRGRSEDSVRKQYERTVCPMYERYVGPTRKHADIVVRGDDPIEESVDRIVFALEQGS